jgi:uncharacterized protein
MALPCPRILPPILLTILLTGCGDEAGSQESASASAALPDGTVTSRLQDSNAGALTVEELTAEPVTAELSEPKADPKAEQPAPQPQSSSQYPDPDAKPAVGAVTELDWDSLIPAEWRPEKIMEEYNVDALEDDDPRAQELWDKLQALWKQAPVVEELNGKRVKLPGFVVPVDWDAEKIGEFLLVPYYGACIHVPPPPANQTVHVITVKGREYSGNLFDTVWVTGTLQVERYSGEMAEAGYRLEATAVEPYEEENAPR